jgi:Na+/H+ antiporter NhaC
MGGSFTIMEFTQKCYEGFSMTDIFLLSMLTGGLALVEKAGGITYLLVQIKKLIKSKISSTRNWYLSGFC